MTKSASEFKFLLYVAGDTENSALAIANLTALCEDHCAGRYKIEVVDVFKHPTRALADRIFMTPTLIRLAPLPARRVVGTLSQSQKLVRALDLEPVAA
jgi:circadian clock protein KaiB